MNQVLIVALAIFIAMALWGWKKGILGLVFSLVSWAFILLFITFAHPYIENYLTNQTDVYQRIYAKTESFLVHKAEGISSDTGISDWYDAMTVGIPASIRMTLTDSMTAVGEGGGLLQQALGGSFGETGLTVGDFGGSTAILQLSNGSMTIGQMICTRITDFIVQSLSILLAYLIAQILVLVVRFMIKGVRCAPVIGPIDGALGLFAGAAEGLLVIWLLFYLAAFLSTTAFGQTILTGVQDSAVLTYLYEHNLLMMWLNR